MPILQDRIKAIVANVRARNNGKGTATVHDLLAVGGINECRGAVILDASPASLLRNLYPLPHEYEQCRSGC